MTPHHHICKTCGDSEQCDGVGKGPICEVDKAAKIKGAVGYFENVMTNPEQEFKRGYYLAVANLMRLHGCEVEARETLMQYGKFDPSDIGEYDLAVLRPLAKETERLLKNAM